MFKSRIKDMEKLKKEPSSVGTGLRAFYQSQEDPGRIAEERALALSVDFLEVDSVWLSDKASVLDTAHKVDLILETGDSAIGIQIKTSEEGALKHKQNASYFKGRFGYPDVIVTGPQIPGWQVLLDLCKATGLNYNKRAEEALTFALAYKGTVQSMRLFKRPGDLTSLGLAVPHPQGLQFIENPPTP